MKNQNKIIKRISLHLFFWLSYILFATASYSILFGNKPLMVIKQTLLILPFIIITSYIILYLIVPFLQHKKKLIPFIIFFLLTPFAVSVIRRFIVIYIFKLNHPDYNEDIQFFNMGFLIFAFENFLVMSVATIIKLLKNWYEIQHQQVILEKQNLENKLELLHHQINPHFLFNVLNNLYSLAINNDDNETANGISKLSGLMRYNLYTNKTDFVPLEKEIDYIRNYIKLQEIRFKGGYNLDIEFNVTGNIESAEIVPFILIMFVENAFKYGIKLNAKSDIKINIQVTKAYIDFYLTNNKNNQNNNMDSGIGLENVKERLNHYYKDKHKLIIKDDKLKYSVYLKLYT